MSRAARFRVQHNKTASSVVRRSNEKIDVVAFPRFTQQAPIQFRRPATMFMLCVIHTDIQYRVCVVEYLCIRKDRSQHDTLMSPWPTVVRCGQVWPS